MASEDELKQLDELIKDIPIEERVPIIALKRLLEERRKIDKQKEEEIDSVHQKYRKMLEPNTKRASEIIKGAPIKDDELKDGHLFNAAEKSVINQHTKGAKIKQYWATAMENSKLQEFITDDDRKVLTSLEDISGQQTENLMTLTFEFSDNEYFAACKVNRQLILQNGQPSESKGDEIKWKPGKSVIATKPKNSKNVPGQRSFFELFQHVKLTSDLELDLISFHGLVFNEIINEIIPYSLEYYLGIVDDDEDGSMDDGEDFDEDDDEDKEEDIPRKVQKKK